MTRLYALCLWLALALPILAQKPHEFCVACHSEQVGDFQTHPHFQKALSCDACHGPSVIALIVCIATPRSSQALMSAATSAA